MTMLSRVFTALSCFLLAASVAAQDAPPTPARPYRGLFGGARPDPSRARLLDLRLSLTGGFDDNLATFAAGTVSDPRLQVRGGMASGEAALAYQRGAREHDWFRAGARAGFRQYPSMASWNAAEFGGDIGFSRTLARRVIVRATQAVARQPFMRLEAVPGLAAGDLASFDHGIVKRDSLGYQATADARFEFGRKTFLTPKYTISGVEMLEGEDRGYQRGQSAGVTLTADRWRRASLGADYSYVTDENSYTGPLTIYRTHNLAASIAYRRTLRGQRQVTFAMRPGVALAEIDTPSVRRYTERRPIAGATARVDFTRTWSWSVEYERGYHYLSGFGEPFFTDNARTTLSGFFLRSVDLALAAGYSNGSVRYLERGGYASVSGTARVRVAVNRRLAFTGQYLYYSYEFGPGVVLPPGFGRNFDRMGVRLGVEVWLPMFR